MTADERTAFRMIAKAHPQECYETDPDEFWAMFQEECPGVPKEVMIRLLEKLPKQCELQKHEVKPLGKNGVCAKCGEEQ